MMCTATPAAEILNPILRREKRTHLSQTPRTAMVDLLLGVCAEVAQFP